MNYLKEQREKQGLSINELAERSGLNKSVISRMESGVSKEENVTVGTLKKLAKALNIKVTDLIDLD